MPSTVRFDDENRAPGRGKEKSKEVLTVSISNAKSLSRTPLSPRRATSSSNQSAKASAATTLHKKAPSPASRETVQTVDPLVLVRAFSHFSTLAEFGDAPAAVFAASMALTGDHCCTESPSASLLSSKASVATGAPDPAHASALLTWARDLQAARAVAASAFPSGTPSRTPSSSACGSPLKAVTPCPARPRPFQRTPSPLVASSQHAPPETLPSSAEAVDGLFASPRGSSSLVFHCSPLTPAATRADARTRHDANFLLGAAALLDDSGVPGGGGSREPSAFELWSAAAREPGCHPSAHFMLGVLHSHGSGGLAGVRDPAAAAACFRRAHALGHPEAAGRLAALEGLVRK